MACLKGVPETRIKRGMDDDAFDLTNQSRYFYLFRRWSRTQKRDERSPGGRASPWIGRECRFGVWRDVHDSRRIRAPH